MKYPPEWTSTLENLVRRPLQHQNRHCKSCRRAQQGDTIYETLTKCLYLDLGTNASPVSERVLKLLATFWKLIVLISAPAEGCLRRNGAYQLPKLEIWVQPFSHHPRVLSCLTKSMGI